MLSFVTTLLRNAPFLVVTLPVLGAVLVAVSSPLGTAAARRTAQANALVTALVALAMAAYYVRTHPEGYPMAARVLPWLAFYTPDEASADSDDGETAADPDEVEWVSRGPDVRIAFSVDGANLWFAVVLCLTMFAACEAGPSDGRWGPVFYVLLLLWEACLLGAFLAADIVLFAVCAEMTTIPVFLMLGGWGGLDRRTAAARWLVVRGLSGACVVVGLACLVVVARWPYELLSGSRDITLSIVRVMASLLSPTTQQVDELWTVIGPWAIGLLMFGFLLRAAAIPLHTWLVPVSLDAPPATNVLLLTGSLNLGLYGLLRFVVPFAPKLLGDAGGTLVGLSVTGAVFAGMLVLAQGNLLKFAACASLANVAVSVAGLFTGSSLGATGAVVFAVHHAAALGLFAYVVGCLTTRFDTADVEAFGGLARRSPRLAVLLGVSLLAIVGFPLTSGFVGRLLLFDGLFRQSSLLAAWAGIGTLLMVWAGLWTLQRLLAGRARLPIVVGRVDGEVPEPDLTWGETAAALPLVVIVLLLGVWPRPVVDATTATLAPQLRSATSSVDHSTPYVQHDGGR